MAHSLIYKKLAAAIKTRPNIVLLTESSWESNANVLSTTVLALVYFTVECFAYI